MQLDLKCLNCVYSQGKKFKAVGWDGKCSISKEKEKKSGFEI